jgi:uncharacterized protein (AIM24 family)
MKIIVHPDKLKTLERGRKLSSVIKESGLNTLPPVASSIIRAAKKFASETTRPWDIEETKQLLKVYTERLNGQPLFAEARRTVYKLDVQGETKRLTIKSKLVDLLYEPYITYYSGKGEVGFAGNVPGEITVLELEPGETIYAQSPSFVAAIGNIEMSLHLRPIKQSIDILGGGSFLLTSFTNKGDSEGLVFFHACGGFDILQLEPNQSVIVSNGSSVAWDSSVQINIERLKFSSGSAGAGLFVNHLTGPGAVVIQTNTLANLKEEIGETICLGPPPVIAWQVLQKEFKRLFFRPFRGVS